MISVLQDNLEPETEQEQEHEDEDDIDLMTEIMYHGIVIR